MPRTDLFKSQVPKRGGTGKILRFQHQVLSSLGPNSERERKNSCRIPATSTPPPPPSPTLGRSCRDGPYPTRPGLTENSPSLSSRWQMIGQSRTRGRIQNGRRPFGGPDWPATIPPTNRTAGSVIFFAGKEGPGRNTLCAADVMTAPELF